MHQPLPGRKAVKKEDIAAVMEPLSEAGTPPSDPMASLEFAIARREMLSHVCRVVGCRDIGNELYTIGNGERSISITGRMLDEYVLHLRKLSGELAPADL